MKWSGQVNEARAKIELQADQKNWHCPSNLILTGQKSPKGIKPKMAPKHIVGPYFGESNLWLKLEQAEKASGINCS